MQSCPCCTGKNYEDCCMPYHLGRLPENALILMRSRYSAYALNLADYIMTTTHPLNPDFQKDSKKWRESILFFSKHTIFKKLEILHFEEKNEIAFVMFMAHLEQNKQDVSFKENSRFEKIGKTWLYRQHLLE